MREKAQGLGLPQAEFIEYVSRGLQAAMEDYNNRDVSKVASAEEQGLQIIVKYMDLPK
jgi:hypothetical protein